MIARPTFAAGAHLQSRPGGPGLSHGRRLIALRSRAKSAASVTHTTAHASGTAPQAARLGPLRACGDGLATSCLRETFVIGWCF
jgi:hypothetical protein